MMSVQITQLLIQGNRESKEAVLYASNKDIKLHCTLSKNCYYCHQTNNHHRSLCPQEFSTIREFMKESAHLVEEVPQNHETSITENVLLSSGESVLMQTAKTKVNKGTSRQRSGKGAIRKRFPLQKPRWEKTKLTIRYLYHETYRKPNEQLFSQ